MFLTIKSYSNGKPIIYGLNSMRSPYGGVIEAADLLADSTGRKKVPEGMFLVGVDSKVRFLPKTRVKNAVATNSPTLTLKLPSMSFMVGDVLYGQAGHAKVALAGTIAENDVLTIRIDGTNYSTSAPATPTATTTAAKFVTDNAATILSSKGVTVTSSAATITLVGTDAHSISVNTDAGAFLANLITTDAGYLGDSVLPLGTILSIAAANTDGERLVTLAANAAYALPANAVVGVNINEDGYLGIYPDPLDYTDLPRDFIAPIYGADGVYEKNLPYIDKFLKRKHLLLNIRNRFYANT